MKIQVGVLTVSDRASRGLYDDLGGPALRKAAEGYGWQVLSEGLVPDEKSEIQRVVREQIAQGCHLVLATGGTGVALRSEEHTSELQSPVHLVCRLLLEKKQAHGLSARQVQAHLSPAQLAQDRAGTPYAR